MLLHASSNSKLPMVRGSLAQMTLLMVSTQQLATAPLDLQLAMESKPCAIAVIFIRSKFCNSLSSGCTQMQDPLVGDYLPSWA